MKIEIKDKERFSTIVSPFVSVILGLIFGFFLLSVSGYDAINGFKSLFVGGIQGSGTQGIKVFCNTLAQMTPLLFTGAAVAFAFRTGLFNIGVPGQLLIGGFVSVLLGVKLDLPPFIFPLICVIVAGIAGGLWGAVPGYLKAKFKINEVVICIMMNYTALWLVSLLSKTLMPNKTYATQSQMAKSNALLKNDFLAKITNNSSLSYAFIIGILVLIFMYIVLEKTTFGYELKAVGFSKDAAKYAGIKVDKNIVYAMIISGAFAGFAGAAYYIGYTNQINYGVILSYGFDGIAVSLLGLNAPIGVFLASFLFGFLRNGSQYMEVSANIPKEIVSIVVASIIYFSAISLLTKNFILKIMNNMRKEDTKK